MCESYICVSITTISSIYLIWNHINLGVIPTIYTVLAMCKIMYISLNVIYFGIKISVRLCTVLQNKPKIYFFKLK